MMLVEQVLSSGDVVTHSTGAPGEAVISFPAKLHAMLEDSESQGFQDIVAWQPGGKSFKVYNQQRFSSEIMSQYFNQTKYKSFQRQLNIYGFRRIHSGESRGGYAHQFFQRGAPSSCRNVVRRPAPQKRAIKMVSIHFCHV